MFKIDVKFDVQLRFQRHFFYHVENGAVGRKILLLEFSFLL